MTKQNQTSEDLKKQAFQEAIEKGDTGENSNYKSDISFLYSLLSYYESTEEYDKCTKLLDKVLNIKNLK